MSIATMEQLRTHYKKILALTELQETQKALESYRNEQSENTEDFEIIQSLDSDISMLDKQYTEAAADIEKENIEIKNVILRVDDTVSRVAGNMHYIHGIPWDMIAFKIRYTNGDSLRNRFYRCFKNIQY